MGREKAVSHWIGIYTVEFGKAHGIPKRTLDDPGVAGDNDLTSVE